MGERVLINHPLKKVNNMVYTGGLKKLLQSRRKSQIGRAPQNDKIRIRLMILLFNEKVERKELLLYELEVENETVDNLLRKISQDAQDRTLRHQKYQSICKEESSIPLENSSPLKLHFSSKNKDFPLAVAIPYGKNCVEFSNLALSHLYGGDDDIIAKVKEEFERDFAEPSQNDQSLLFQKMS